MTSATDIITYIGVPLAVFGVTPLIWNMVKSFIIRRRLLRVIPSNLRQFFSLSMDPAAGTVAVAVQQIFLDTSSFFGYDLVGPDPAVDAAENHLSTTWGDVAYDEKIYKSSRRSRENALQMRITFSPALQGPPVAFWMPLTTTCLTAHRKTRSPPQSQYIVDGSLNCPPTLLESKWPVFVYLALGLGVMLGDSRHNQELLKHDMAKRAGYEYRRSPLSEQPLQRVDPSSAAPTSLEALRESIAEGSVRSPIRLKDLFQRTIMTVSMENEKIVAHLENRDHVFSLHKLMAWESIMIVSKDSQWLCVPLWNGPAFPISDIIAFSREGIAFWNHERKIQAVLSSNNSSQDHKYEHMNFSGLRPVKFLSASLWTKALTWILHAERIRLESNDILPTCPTILLLRRFSFHVLQRFAAPEVVRQLLLQLLDSDFAASEVWKRIEGSHPDNFSKLLPPIYNLAYDKFEKSLTFDPRSWWRGNSSSRDFDFDKHKQLWNILTRSQNFVEIADICQPNSKTCLELDISDSASPKVLFAHVLMILSVVHVLDVVDIYHLEEPLRRVLPVEGENRPIITDSIFIA